MRDIFREIDKNGRNSIELNDVYRLMKKFQIPVSMWYKCWFTYDINANLHMT